MTAFQHWTNSRVQVVDRERAETAAKNEDLESVAADHKDACGLDLQWKAYSKALQLIRDVISKAPGDIAQRFKSGW